MPTNYFTSQANAKNEDHTATKTHREGIINLYANFAEDHVEGYENQGDVNKISRKKVERQLLSAIDKAKFPIKYKMSWYHAVLVSTNFDAFWKGVSKRHKLPISCTKRFEPDPSLYEYDAPTDLEEAEEGDEEGIDHEAEDYVQDETHSAIHNDATLAKNIPPLSVSQTPARPTNHDAQSSSSDSGDSSRSGTPDGWVPLTQENKLAPHPQRPRPNFCAECGSPYRPCYCVLNRDDGDNDSGCASERSSQHGDHESKVLGIPLDRLRGHYETPSAVSGHVNGLAGEEGDDSTYEEPSSTKSKGKGKAKASSYEYSHAAAGYVDGLARDDGDDSEYEDTRSKSKGKAKAKASPTLKDAAKPKGVTKKKAAPKKKEQTTAQLKTAAAKTREPAKPKATKKAATEASQAPTTPAHASNGNKTQAQVPTTPSQAAITPARALNGNNPHIQATTVPDELGQKIARAQAANAPAQAQGLKRMMELYPNDDEDDSPATKRAKVGGAAAANGGRKKATPKRTTKLKPIEEEWDGIQRGFDNY